MVFWYCWHLKREQMSDSSGWGEVLLCVCVSFKWMSEIASLSEIDQSHLNKKIFLLFFKIFLWHWGLNSGPHTC
jgi:hypothetical protein